MSSRRDHKFNRSPGRFLPRSGLGNTASHQTRPESGPAERLTQLLPNTRIIMDD
jgi:hypothetical protein